jgi:hypothetical protein
VPAGALRKEHVVDTAGEEDRCLSAAGPGGEIWAAGFTTAEGQADFLVKVYTTPSNQAILTDRFDLAGGDDKALAMAYQRNRGAATGFGTSANGDRDIVTRVHDLAHRKLLWEDVQDPSGGGHDEGLAAVVAGGRLFVAGHAGGHPLVIAFGWGAPKVQYWQVIGAQPGTARAIAYANGRVFVAGTITGADDVTQLWIAAYDAF